MLGGGGGGDFVYLTPPPPLFLVPNHCCPKFAVEPSASLSSSRVLFVSGRIYIYLGYLGKHSNQLLFQKFQITSHHSGSLPSLKQF